MGLHYRLKEEHDAKKRYKVLKEAVVKGYEQKAGIDFPAPVVNIRAVLSIVATENLHLM